MSSDLLDVACTSQLQYIHFRAPAAAALLEVYMCAHLKRYTATVKFLTVDINLMPTEIEFGLYSASSIAY